MGAFRLLVFCRLKYICWISLFDIPLFLFELLLTVAVKTNDTVKYTVIVKIWKEENKSVIQINAFSQCTCCSCALRNAIIKISITVQTGGTLSYRRCLSVRMRLIHITVSGSCRPAGHVDLFCLHQSHSLRLYVCIIVLSRSHIHAYRKKQQPKLTCTPFIIHIHCIYPTHITVSG